MLTKAKIQKMVNVESLMPRKRSETPIDVYNYKCAQLRNNIRNKIDELAFTVQIYEDNFQQMEDASINRDSYEHRKYVLIEDVLNERANKLKEFLGIRAIGEHDD